MSLRYAPVRWLAGEARILVTAVREPQLAISLLVGLLLWSLAYQLPFATTLHIGGDSATHRREDDAPFLHGWNGSEPDVRGADWWTLAPGYGYRWASPVATVDLPGVGAGRWLIQVTASSGRADGSATSSLWHTGAQQFLLTIAPDSHTYRVIANATATGDLSLQLQTPRYTPAVADPRDLGFVVSNIVVAPVEASWRWPAVGQLGWLLLVLALGYGCCRRVGLSMRETFALALVCAGGIAILLVSHRLPLTIFTPIVAAVLAGSYGLAVVLAALVRSWNADLALRWSPVPLVVLAFALRVGGLFHPHTLINDIGLHANNLAVELSRGTVFFTEGLPSDAGGGQSPYPPGSYLLLLPFQVLMQPSMQHRIQLLNIGVSLLDSLVVALIWVVLWRSGLGQRAAWFGAALYLAPPPLLASFSIGEAANIGGQAIALPALAVLALATPTPLPWRVAWRWFVPLLCVALLAHMGVTISLACVLAMCWLQTALSSRWRAQLSQLTVYGLLALLLVVVCYYSVPLFVDIFAARVGGAAATPASQTPGWQRVLGRGATLFIPGNRITPLLTVAGLAGVFLVSFAPRSGALPLVLRAWWLGTVLSLALLLVAQQGVREQHFLYPALCLGAGPLLAAWWRRGGAGRAVALAGVSLPIVIGILFWVHQLVEYLH